MLYMETGCKCRHILDIFYSKIFHWILWWTLVRGLLLFFTLPGQNKKTWHGCVENILFTQSIHFIFTDVMQFIYFMQMFFLTFFYFFTANLGWQSHMWGVRGCYFDNSYFYFSKLIVKNMVSLLETLCNLMYAKLGGAMLLYNRGFSVVLQGATNEHFKSLSDICCFPLVERLYYCMKNCQKSFDIVVKLLTLPSSDFFFSFLRITSKRVTGVSHCI